MGKSLVIVLIVGILLIGAAVSMAVEGNVPSAAKFSGGDASVQAAGFQSVAQRGCNGGAGRPGGSPPPPTTTAASG